MCKRNKTLAKTHQWQTKWRYNVLDVFFEFNAANISKRKEKKSKINSSQSKTNPYNAKYLLHEFMIPPYYQSNSIFLKIQCKQ